jgi:hypothetical protein
MVWCVLIATCKQLVWSIRIGRNMPIWVLIHTLPVMAGRACGSKSKMPARASLKRAQEPIEMCTIILSNQTVEWRGWKNETQERERERERERQKTQGTCPEPPSRLKFAVHASISSADTASEVSMHPDHSDELMFVKFWKLRVVCRRCAGSIVRDSLPKFDPLALEMVSSTSERKNVRGCKRCFCSGHRALAWWQKLDRCIWESLSARQRCQPLKAMHDSRGFVIWRTYQTIEGQPRCTA